MKKSTFGIGGIFWKLPVVAQSIKSKIGWINQQARENWGEILLVVALAASAGIASYLGAQLIHPWLLTDRGADLWFSADIPRVFANMTDRFSNHSRTKVHPIFSLIAFPPVFLMHKVLGLDALTAVRIAIAAVAALCIMALFIVLRLIGCRRFDAALFSILGATSAAAMFWFIVPETYPFGALSILAGLCLAAIAQYRKLSAQWYAVVSAATLSITTTNWMVGILATLAKYRRKWAWKITLDALCLNIVLWSVQKSIFPSAGFFIVLGDSEEKNYMLRQASGGFWHVLQSFVAHTMVMPDMRIIPHWKKFELLRVLTQRAIPGSASVWGTVAVILWMALLALGIWGFFAAKQHRQLRIVLGFSILGQLALHTVYGEETFLYSLHFLPLLIVLAAFSTQTPARSIGLVLAGMLVLTAGVNNGLQLLKAKEVMNSQAAPRTQLLKQMQQRPTDPSTPGVGSFDVAVNLKTTSDRR
ncbi:hypothetical protein [Microseira sp. BLCC-F43]|jgi:hypothetical protein|uniref:hypothetical protein n=1 Tax=Microseira sp. BLCC-F43 TaxID=3153602 RepID=UPI0035B93FC3